MSAVNNDDSEVRRTNAESNTTIEDLPTELLEKIFKFLPPAHLEKKVVKVSKKWLTVTSESSDLRSMYRTYLKWTRASF